MAVKYTTQAFVFKKEDRLESDRVFSVFTKEFGKLEIFGKAIRKIDSKLRGGLELFSFSEIEFVQGKNKKTLTDALLLKNSKPLQQNLEKFEVAGKISEILGNFIHGQELDEKIWNVIADTFRKLGAPETNNKFLYYYFFWNFISLLGYGPELFVCASCSRALSPENIYFSNNEGGALCQSCSAKYSSSKKINADAVKILRLILQKEWELLAKLKIATSSKKLLQEISEKYYHYLLNTVGDEHNH